MFSLRSALNVSVVVVTLACVAAAGALALAAAPAQAFTAWEHDGATDCSTCHNSTPTDATCTTCHTSFASFPGQNCWSCHAPGQDTSTLSGSSGDCSQTCHLYSPYYKAYTIEFTHGTNPHLGSTSAPCLTCHPMSNSVTDPGSSPHHSGAAGGFTVCTPCHAGLQNHAGVVACATCHKTAAAFHTYQATSPGFVQCRTCHPVKHAGRNVAQSKCSACHKGSTSVPGKLAQHSATVTKARVCSVCHSEGLHAKRLGSLITCQTCHTGKYHALQRLPGNTTCTRCHTAATHHSNGFACVLCHRAAVHAVLPHALARL